MSETACAFVDVGCASDCTVKVKANTPCNLCSKIHPAIVRKNIHNSDKTQEEKSVLLTILELAVQENEKKGFPCVAQRYDVLGDRRVNQIVNAKVDYKRQVLGMSPEESRVVCCFMYNSRANELCSMCLTPVREDRDLSEWYEEYFNEENVFRGIVFHR
ncbi:hypothetical protein EK21DRAFT_83819 [Setomelanomma holmii]|uniref:Uncharacterized protein n=1 Tax=Setomelanomma holmii TaxID=210430 RepID=A0A9P4LQE9_9PLEO|nr:hypothetical protein EK21DRAFT_83819 [Setomelanomma holmii]